MILGSGASPGIAVGKIFIHSPIVIDTTMRKTTEPAFETQRLESALDKSRAQLMEIKEIAHKKLGPEKAEIFEAHLLLLDDPEILEQTRSKIFDDGVVLEHAYNEVISGFEKIFSSMSSEYMRERATDLRDVAQRVLRNLSDGHLNSDLTQIPKGSILVARDLTPSEVSNIDFDQVAGMITEVGGRTSHTAIIARTLDVPLVVGAQGLMEKIRLNELVALDGDSGEVFIQPSQEKLDQLNNVIRQQKELKISLRNFRGRPTLTSDGHRVELAGNIGTPKDVDLLLKNDAEGVGLFRTEFIYLGKNSMPTEDEQFRAYSEVLKAMGSKPVIIRTLDIGGDKELAYLGLKKETNPFLGYRAIRICLDQETVFRTQLRALVRASIFGNLKIMFPMISSLEELQQARSILSDVTKEIHAKTPLKKEIDVGIMIEIPSAAMMSDVLARHVSFFSIGTNDLIQYMCAVDRMNEKIHHLYDAYNPGVLRIIKNVIDNAHRAGIWCGMCGEVAGDLSLVPLLIGMGLDEFSMSPNSILPVRKLISSIDRQRAAELWLEVSGLETSKEIKALLNHSPSFGIKN